MKTKIKLVTILFLSFGTGCSSYELKTAQLNQEAQNVLISSDIPKECSDLGEVIGESESQNLVMSVIGAKNDIRNQTQMRGGNRVVLQTNSTQRVYNSRYLFWTKGSHYSLLTGRALKCSSGLIGFSQ